MEEMKRIIAIIMCAFLIASSGFAMLQVDDGVEGKAIVQDGVMYVTHAPIRIDSDAEFTVANGVIGGDGSSGNPWIIENYDHKILIQSE